MKNRYFAYVIACCHEIISASISSKTPPTPKEALETLIEAIENYECPYDSIDEDSVQSSSLQELAATLRNLKIDLDWQGSEKTRLQKKYDFLSISVIPEMMDELGVETMKITGVGRLQVASDINCAVPSANKEAVQQWLRDNGHESLVQETINSSTFKAFIKERMKEGKEYPKDLIKVNPFSRATVVKG